VITETDRTAVINGWTLLLPQDGNLANTTHGVASVNLPGTAVDSPTADNPTYDDFAAIWDAFNGNTTATGTVGVPPGWATGAYRSATPTIDGHHVIVSLETGATSALFDTSFRFVAFEVM
jgi:hypothetical protein